MDFGDSDLPATYRHADEQALAAQKRVLRAVKVSLGGAVAAAVFGTVSLESGSVDWAAAVASLAFLVATLSTAWLLLAKPEGEWYDARALAESAKTLAWQYAVGGGEFAKGAASEGSVRRKLLQRLTDMVEGLDELRLSPQQDESELPSGLEVLRGSSLEERRETYLKSRIGDQRSWYSGKAAWNEARRVGWTAAAVALLSAGFLFGVAQAFFGLEADLLGPAAAAAGSAMAWARSKDYAQLAAAYTVTAHELRLIEADADRSADERAWAPFVERAERAISREHTLWKARRGEPRMGP